MFSHLGMEDSSKLGGPNGLAGHPRLKTLTLLDNRQGEQDGETRMSDHTIILNSPIPAEEVPLGISSHSSSRIFAATFQRHGSNGARMPARKTTTTARGRPGSSIRAYGHSVVRTHLGITRALSLVRARTVPGAEARVPVARAWRASRNRPTALVMRKATGGIKQEASGSMLAVCD